jgi:hypothetical protein
MNNWLFNFYHYVMRKRMSLIISLNYNPPNRSTDYVKAFDVSGVNYVNIFVLVFLLTFAPSCTGWSAVVRLYYRPCPLWPPLHTSLAPINWPQVMGTSPIGVCARASSPLQCCSVKEMKSRVRAGPGDLWRLRIFPRWIARQSGTLGDRAR